MRVTVLCAVDINSLGNDILVIKQAARLAKMESAQLDVVTVLPDYGMSFVGDFFDKSYYSLALKKAKQELESFVVSALGTVANDEVRHLVVLGSVYEEILKVAAADNADLIVIGAHKPGVSDFLLGPNSARVVRHSSCSVYVVR